ncbi:MAG: VWA domain-containing protein, partial [Acidobacteria bacterium]|nr:VWA domain-containing protein [Acidobacteriota bacterium]
KFVEERDLTVLLVLDVSASQGFGTRYLTKRDLMAELAGLISFAAVKNNDRVGALFATDRMERFVPPRKGLDHALVVVREALSGTPKGTGTNLALALRKASALLKQRAVVFVISDFLDRDYEKELRVLRRRHDVIAIPLTDPGETSFPKAGLVRLRDAETGVVRVFDASDPKFRAAWGRHAAGRFPDPGKVLRTSGIDSIPLRTDQPYEKELVRFFKERERRKGMKVR